VHSHGFTDLLSIRVLKEKRISLKSLTPEPYFECLILIYFNWLKNGMKNNKIVIFSVAKPYPTDVATTPQKKGSDFLRAILEGKKSEQERQPMYILFCAPS
jgi:hypothetical protein